MYDAKINNVYNEFDSIALLFEFEFDNTFTSPITQYNIRSQIRDRYGELIDTPHIEITSDNSILITPSKTLERSDALYTDIELSKGDMTIHTDVYGFRIKPVVTRPL